MKNRRRGPGKPEIWGLEGTGAGGWGDEEPGGLAPCPGSALWALDGLEHNTAPGQARLTAGWDWAVIYRGDLVTVYT